MSIVKINNEQDTFYTIRTRAFGSQRVQPWWAIDLLMLFSKIKQTFPTLTLLRESVLHSERLKGEDGTLELATTQTNNTLTVIDSTYTDVVVRTNKTDLSELECINKMIAFG